MNRIPAEAQAIAIIAIAAGLAALAVSVATASHRTSSSTAPTRHTSVRLDAVVTGPLDGLPTPRSRAVRRPVAVVIDNVALDARPQSGLSQASVVFETLVEGGITRLLPIYLENDASQLGPIRSARPYMVAWVAGLHGLLVHAGGSPAALSMLKSMSAVGNVEALLPDPHFKRMAGRSAPDNLYSSSGAARTIARENGWTAGSIPTWFLHSPAAPPHKRGPAATISLDFSTTATPSPASYAVSYRYDPISNRYVRAVGGEPDTDAVTHRPLEPSNVVILFTDITPITGDSLGRLDVRTAGAGQAVFLRDGHVVKGTWSKTSNLAPLQFLDRAGNAVALAPGQTWIEVVPPGALTYGAGR